MAHSGFRVPKSAAGVRAVPVGEAMTVCMLPDHFLRDRGQVGR
jgi:chorismate synthase